MIRLAAALLLLLLSFTGCGATVRLAVGPTVDTDGHVGVLARVGGGYAAGLGHRPRSALLAVAHGEGGYSGANGGFGGGGFEVDYLYQPPAPSRAPAVRAGIATSFLAFDGAGSPLRASSLNVAVMGPLLSRERESGDTLRFSDSSKAGGLHVAIDWLTRLYLGAELDAALQADSGPMSAAKGRFGLLLALDFTEIGWIGR